MRVSNILDPVHAELDPRVFDQPASLKPILKPLHSHWIKSQIYKTLEDAGYTNVEDWLTLVLTGSLTTFQYSDDSDVDVSLFVDVSKFPEWSRAEMIALMVEKLDGKLLPGTPFPLQDFVVGEGIKPSDLYKPGLRSGYNIDNGKWVVAPERNRVHDVKAEQGGFWAWALQMADKMERLLKYEPDQAIEFWHSIHRKRRLDMAKGKGDFSESNIIYKMFAQRGLFPEISQVSGEHIAHRKLGGKILYHHAPSKYRESIEQRGLNPAHYPGEREESMDPLVYWSDIADHSPGMDIWQAHAPDLPELDYDNNEEAPEEQWYSSAPVAPHLIQRIAKKAPQPPNYKVGGMGKHCSNCKMYDHGECWGYGNKKVKEEWVCDSWASEHKATVIPQEILDAPPTIHRSGRTKVAADALQYDRDQHPEGKGFILDDGSVWTWPTENLKPMHMQYSYKAKQQGHGIVPGSAFHIKEGKVWQYGPGRSLSPEQQQTILAADPKLELAPSRQQEQLDTTPGFGHGQNVLDLLERGSSWTFRGAINIHDVASRIYEKALEGVGSTINLHGEAPHTRYGFAPDLATQTPFPMESFSLADVEGFIQRFADRLADSEKFVGSWIQGDQVILDVTEGHDDFDTAHQRAWAGHQQSMWDSQINDEVPVRGLDYDQTPFLEGNG